MFISKYLPNYAYGALSTPGAFAIATAMTALSQLAGVTKINSIQCIMREFQSTISMHHFALLPAWSLGSRFLVQTGILIAENQLTPFIEEVMFRWLIQDKILSRFTPKEKITQKKRIQNLVNKTLAPINNPTPPFLTKDQLVRIAIASALFGAMHYGLPGSLPENASLSASELGLESRFSVLHCIGMGIVYGIIYEKFGFIGSFAAHSAWNTFFDINANCSWQAVTEEWVAKIKTGKVTLVE